MPRKTGVEEDPKNLPSFTPVVVEASPPPEEAESVAFDSEFDRIFRKVVDVRAGPDDIAELTLHATGAMKLAQHLRRARSTVDHYIGELASVVEDYSLWKYYPGCESSAAFWAETGLSQSLIRAAIAFHRHGLPAAEKVGVDVKTPGLAGQLTGKQASAIATIGRKAESQKLYETEEGKVQVKEHIENILAAPSEGEVISYMRTQVQHKPERVPCFLKAEVVSDEYEGPRVRLQGELTRTQVEAGEEGLLYFVIDMGGRTVEFHEVSQVLKDLTPTTNEEDDLGLL